MAPRTATPDRLQLDSEYSFAAATERALKLVEDGHIGEPYAKVLKLLSDCPEISTNLLDRVLDGTMTVRQVEAIARQERTGASFKQLASIAHAAGFSYSERSQWYRVAEDLALSMRHCGHILSKLAKLKKAPF
jgi:HTH domain found in ParB protein